jgi:hypothetical protein
MQITIKRPESKLIEEFKTWLEMRAMDNVHADSRDAIARVIDNVLAIEIKKSEGIVNDEVIDVPDGTIELSHGNEPLPEVELPSTVPLYGPAKPSKNGTNNHKSEKVRPLSYAEKNELVAEFKNLNGIANDNHWVQFRKDNFKDDVKIFQVTGYISRLHYALYCRKGKCYQQVKDIQKLKEYLAFMHDKYFKWSHYNSAKYNTYRAQKDIIERHIIEKTPKEDLPLLIGQFITEEAQEMLSKRLGGE